MPMIPTIPTIHDENEEDSFVNERHDLVVSFIRNSSSLFQRVVLINSNCLQAIVIIKFATIILTPVVVKDLKESRLRKKKVKTQ